MCGTSSPWLVRGDSASLRLTRLLVLLPNSGGLGPFQRCPAAEISRRWGCGGWLSVYPPHLAALLSVDGWKSPSWLGLEVPEKRLLIEVILCRKHEFTSDSQIALTCVFDLISESPCEKKYQQTQPDLFLPMELLRLSGIIPKAQYERFREQRGQRYRQEYSSTD